MTWARLEDTFPFHPKIVGLSDKAFRLHVTAICYCAQHLSDGFVPKAALERLGRVASIARPSRVHHTLENAGLWEQCEGGWQIHDWSDYNPTAEKVRADRTAAKERMRRIRSGGRAQRAFARTEPEGSPERSPERSRHPSHTPSPNGDGMGRAPAPAREGRAPARAPDHDQPQAEPQDERDAMPTPLTPHKLEELASVSDVMAKVAIRRRIPGDAA